MRYEFVVLLFLLTFACRPDEASTGNSRVNASGVPAKITEVNQLEIPSGSGIIAFQNVRLIDGTGAAPIDNAVVIIEGNIITHVGENESGIIPSEAEIIDGTGQSLLPGLIDAHFHLDGNKEFPSLFLRHGVTTVRDPGAWIEAYDKVRASADPVPRLFLTGPHLDMPPPAYPSNSYLVRDKVEAQDAVNKFADQGASAIKVYFRLSAAIIEAVCRIADQRGIPVTAHLEITNATQAIEAGVDGIEHITSFGTDLVPSVEAERYKQSVLADNNARRDGRYSIWNDIDLSHTRVDSLLRFLKQNGTVVSPTLGAFEHQLGTDTLTLEQVMTLGGSYVGNYDINTIKVRAFTKMKAFVGRVHQAGIPVVTGSHSWVPYAEVGWAYQREMELLAESGLTNMEVIVASTLANARFFRIEDRLGSVEVGKQADLLLVEGDPLQDLRAFYRVSKVLLNGVLVK